MENSMLDFVISQAIGDDGTIVEAFYVKSEGLYPMGKYMQVAMECIIEQELKKKLTECQYYVSFKNQGQL